MDSFDLIRKFHSTLPIIRKWIDDLLEGHKDEATPIIKLRFPRLQQVFPTELLGKAKVVVVTGKLPFPPLSRMGLPELAQVENMAMDGITYADTFFINQAYRSSESLHFHELIHVVQWERVGVDNFLLAYGVGLMQFGYQNSPLEQMAYSLQEASDRGNPAAGIVDIIRQRTDAIWRSVTPLINRA
jgi:hypothetical protein